MIENVRHIPDPVACPHFLFGPADPDGVAVCEECGAAVRVQAAGVSIWEFLLSSTTVIAREGDDVSLPRQDRR